MQGTPDFAIVAVSCHVLLGVAVFLTNPGRAINRSFLVLTLVLGGWIVGIQTGHLSADASVVAFAIRLSSACGALMPTAFALLRQSIIFHEESWLAHVRRIRWWLLAGLLFAILCFSPYYLASVEFAPAVGGNGAVLVHPLLHPAGKLYWAYLAVSTLTVTALMFRDQWRPRISGVHRVELQFIWLGCLTIFLSVYLSAFLQYLLPKAQIIRFVAAFRVIIFDIIIAYGITSRGILQIRAVLRLMMSYLLLASYSGVIFGFVWLFMRWLFHHGGVESDVWPSALAGGAAAVLVNSFRSPFRRVATWILPPSDLDFEKTFNKVAHILQSVSTLDELLDEFANVLGQTVGAYRVRVFLHDGHGFWEHRFLEIGGGLTPTDSSAVFLAEDDPVVTSLRAGAADVAMEELARHASTAEQRALLGRLRALDSDLIVPVRYRNALTAMVLLSGRVGGRIYGGDGRSTLLPIAKQLGVAIANSRLYTEAYRSQAYNRLLVEHLPCGVITTDPGGVINVLNPEARRLLQVDEQIPAGAVELPAGFSELVKPSLRNHAESPPEDIVLRVGARDQAHLRVNCMPFEGEHGELLGAVLVLNDHTTLERLQRQVRQADRLASIGTLASGMAHEIKNPLTALKTFTQLLPKRYNDAEFRHDFSGLAGSEIARIERIVNQLLAFARPAPLMIEQVNLHEIVGNAVKLIGPQASRQEVTVRKSLHADPDYIAADKDRLQQVLLNLLLNALQASEPGGWIELTSEMEPGTADQDALIRLDVRDSGKGIPQDMIPHIFDPFFTTKSEGTGLGLSVSYNIVSEHKGRLEVQSEIGKGTCFSLYLPVC